MKREFKVGEELFYLDKDFNVVKVMVMKVYRDSCIVQGGNTIFKQYLFHTKYDLIGVILEEVRYLEGKKEELDIKLGKLRKVVE